MEEVKRVNLDGPPGTGKSSRLTRLFIAAAEELGPKKVGAVTFTRSAAEVLRQRAGEALNLGKVSHVLRRLLPYVGTVHSIVYQTLGHPKLVGGKELDEFCDYMNLPQVRGVPNDPDDLDSFWTPEDVGRRPGVGMMLRVLSASRHRGVPIREVVPDLVPPTLTSLYRPDWFESLAEKYTAWKRDSGLLDYDDLLDAGKKLTLPVSVLLCDEVQDNSKLLWEVMDAWAVGIRMAVFAGDAFQAIYRFSGANPDLFLNHPGEWGYLTVSHRLDDASAAYSHDVLRAGGWDMEGKKPVRGGGRLRADGSALLLARTNSLVARLEDEQARAGEPYLLLGRYSPWTSLTADAYRVMSTLRNGGVIRASQLQAMVKAARPGALSREAVASLSRLSSGERVVTAGDVARVMSLDSYAAKNPDVWSYMERVERKHGYTSIYSRPKVLIGTIHKAKGMEADEVVLLQDWGVLPAKVASVRGDGSRSEACVAYVATTRHRGTLSIRYLGDTPSYPFPQRREAV